MKRDIELLEALERNEGYKRLLGLWMQDLTEIEAKRDTAASRGQESAWRYWAGQEKGFKKAMMKLNEEMIRLSEEGGESGPEPSEMIERLMTEARGEKTQ